MRGPLVLVALSLLAGCVTTDAMAEDHSVPLFVGTATYTAGGEPIHLVIDKAEAPWHGGVNAEVIRTIWTGDLSSIGGSNTSQVRALAAPPCAAEGLLYELDEDIAGYDDAAGLALPPLQAFFGHPASSPEWLDAHIQQWPSEDSIITTMDHAGFVWQFEWSRDAPIPGSIRGPYGATLDLVDVNGTTETLSCTRGAKTPDVPPQVAPTRYGPASDLGIPPGFADIAEQVERDPTLIRFALLRQTDPDMPLVSGRATPTTSLDGSAGPFQWRLTFQAASGAGILILCQDMPAGLDCSEHDATPATMPGSSHADVTPWHGQAETLMGVLNGARFAWNDAGLDVHYESAVSDGTRTLLGDVHVDGSNGRLISAHGHVSLGAMDWTP